MQGQTGSVCAQEQEEYVFDTWACGCIVTCRHSRPLIQGAEDHLGSSLIASAAGNANGTLGNSGEHLLLVEDAGDAVGHVQALQASKGKEGGIDDTLIELPEAGLDVAAEVHDLQCWET